jgi:hypothetical protein
MKADDRENYLCRGPSGQAPGDWGQKIGRGGESEALVADEVAAAGPAGRDKGASRTGKRSGGLAFFAVYWVWSCLKVPAPQASRVASAVAKAVAGQGATLPTNGGSK